MPWQVPHCLGEQSESLLLNSLIFNELKKFSSVNVVPRMSFTPFIHSLNIYLCHYAQSPVLGARDMEERDDKETLWYSPFCARPRKVKEVSTFPSKFLNNRFANFS